MSSDRLSHTPDMIFALAERFYLIAQDELWAVPYYEHYTALARQLEHSGWKVRKSMTQTDMILKHLRATGSITQREAYIDYGIQSFHRRLSDLKELGYEIRGVRKHHPTTGQEYSRYYLVREHGVIHARIAV